MCSEDTWSLEGQDGGPAGSSEKNEMFVTFKGVCLSALVLENLKKPSDKHDLGLS